MKKSVLIHSIVYSFPLGKIGKELSRLHNAVKGCITDKDFDVIWNITILPTENLYGFLYQHSRNFIKTFHE